ncbi:serine/threonine-protein phosphatase 7 long form homolog [Rutidosis leptorrhynchoides]|uniref:serine/threonine-protein phosphatase 7 long form homolog n=1 Tax=Rutidosis leptorrhynchoides TaxID=125765 RepID=UPI003A991616
MAERSSWLSHGPPDGDMLWMQPSHRSANIFRSRLRREKILKVRRADSFFWVCMNDGRYCPPKVMGYIEKLGFHLASTIGHVKYDHHLVTTLDERWRPETHTFHFSMREATITLQDVEPDRSGTPILLSSIGAHVEMFLGAPPHSDIEAHNLSWSSTVLAYTYRGLCDSALMNEKDFIGCGLLLQVWAWERIVKIRASFGPGVVPPMLLLLAAKWSKPLRKTHVESNSLVAFKD